MTAQFPGRKPGRPKGQIDSVKTRGSTTRVGDSARVTRSVATYEIAGRSVVLGGNLSARCSVCKNKYIFEVQEQLLLMRGYPAILASLPEEVRDPESQWHLTVDMLKHHVKAGHLPSRDVAVQTIMTDRMQALGKAIETHHGVMTDHVVLGRTVINRYFEFLMKNPNFVPEPAQVTAMVKMFAEAEQQQAQSLDASVYNQVIGVMVEVIRSVAPDSFDEIMHRVSSNPILLAIMEQQKQQQAAALTA